MQELLDFLQRLDARHLDHLYAQPSACLVVFRMLLPQSQSLIMNLLYTFEESISEVQNTSILSKLGIVSNQRLNPVFQSSLCCALTGTITSRSWIGGSFGHLAEHQQMFSDDHLREYSTRKWESMLHFMVGSSGDSEVTGFQSLIPPTVLHLLLNAGFMRYQDDNNSSSAASRRSKTAVITQHGFHFLLQPPRQQLWQLLICHPGLTSSYTWLPSSQAESMGAAIPSNADASEKDQHRAECVADIMGLYFELSCLDVGRVYLSDKQVGDDELENLGGDNAQEKMSMERMRERVRRRNERRRAVIKDLADLGLVFLPWSQSIATSPVAKRKRVVKRTEDEPLEFVPTPLAGWLSANSSNERMEKTKSLSSGTSENGFVVLETNYRIYAFTDSPLQIAILSLFVKLRFRFPSFVVGVITRDSVRRAFNYGITANQMIRYLCDNLLPKMKGQLTKLQHERHTTNLLPTTITDQLNLWQNERYRLRIIPPIVLSTPQKQQTPSPYFNEQQQQQPKKSSEDRDNQYVYLYTDFPSRHVFNKVLEYAKRIDCVLWHSPIPPPNVPITPGKDGYGRMCILEEGHLVMRDFVKRILAGATD